MFDKFGEFDSAEELNAAAAGLLEEGDIGSLGELAKENGIDVEDVQDYIDGYVPKLTNTLLAAYGRLKAEEAEEKKDMEKSPLFIIRSMVRSMCEDEKIAMHVMKKGKRTKEILEAMRKAAGKHKSGNSGVCCGTDRDLQKIIRTYYLGSGEELTEEIERLYQK